jgi:hypothetical protein
MAEKNLEGLGSRQRHKLAVSLNKMRQIGEHSARCGLSPTSKEVLTSEEQ